MNMLRHIALLLLMAYWAGPAKGQTTWHVDDDCSPPGAGTEVDPFCTIQDGVNAAQDGDTVLQLVTIRDVTIRDSHQLNGGNIGDRP